MAVKKAVTKTTTKKRPTHKQLKEMVKAGYVEFWHPSVMLKLKSGESIEVDQEISELVQLVNSIDGIKTYGSCQGDFQLGGCIGFGYVQFGFDGSEGNARVAAAFLIYMLQWMNNATDKSDDFRFSSEIASGDDFSFKWFSESMYPAILEAAHLAKESVISMKAA
jgi:hypothetical protein